MSRIIKAGLIQAHNIAPEGSSIDEIKKANIDHQMKFVEEAAKQGRRIYFPRGELTPAFNWNIPARRTQLSLEHVSQRMRRIG